MNKHVGFNEAQTQLSSLLDEVEGGSEVTIMRHGKPVAKLVRASVELTPEEIEKRRAAIRRLRENAQHIGLNLSQEEIKSWIEDGRR